jgi:CheY-like chemotaxis protein
MNTSPISICSAPLRDTQPEAPEVSRPGPQTMPQAGAQQAPGPPKRSLNILCIDDDESILELMKDCLAHYGHQVRVASGGKCGIELFRTAMLKSEPCEVVITDLGMPDMDGHEVARMIKAESPGTPIIMMTGEGRNMKPGVAAASAVDVVVSKPPRIQELNDLLLQITAPKE